ncbi:MAG: hypothetical protein KME14_09380 [Tildeniella torsiva UHER 1998/13D]|jgi:hypothetical protein|nr:hypothetical protein [Tildeniella torsiva UHER 1998/13D]
MNNADSLTHLFPPASTAQSSSSAESTERPAKDSDIYLDQLVDQILAVAKPKSAHS